MVNPVLHIPRELDSPSEEFLQASENIGLYWWYWDPHNRYLHVSPGLLTLFGIDEMAFDHTIEMIYPYVHPEDIDKNRDRIENLIKGKAERYEMEFRVKDPGGGWRWFFNRGGVRMWDKRGEAILVGGITIEISGEFRHLLAMVEQKEKFEFVFHHTTEPILILKNVEGGSIHVRDANQAALDLFQMDKDRMISGSPGLFDSGEIKVAGRRILSQLRKKGYANFEMKVIPGDGEKRWLEFSVTEFGLAEEDLMLVIISDRTRRKEAEEALKETERIYRTLFEAADDRIGLFNLDQEPVLLNAAFYESLGYTREEFLAGGGAESIHPDDQIRLQEEGKALFKDGFTMNEYRVMHKDGHYLHMSSKAVLIPGDEGDKDLVLFAIRDISDRKKFISELEQAKRAAEESDRLKSAFLANMSHEIRTPMNSIVGFSNLLVTEGLDHETRKTYVQRIVRNSEQLLVLISDIIDLAKIESGQLPLVYGKISISDLLTNMRQYAEEELRRQDRTSIQLYVEEPPVAVELEVDVLRIEQVMKNLINNALKFTQEGSVTIGFNCGSKKNRGLFFVQDTGIGIESDHFALIFEQFRQVDGSDTRRFGGTGLGLAICRNLVQMMGGRIWVESEPGNGALFQVELPLRRKITQAVREKQIVLHESASSNGNPLRILVVDDEPDSAELLVEMLSAAGHSVHSALNGYEALEYMERQLLPDLIFLDVRMPVLTGNELLHILRSRYPELKIVAQSAHALPGDRERFLKEGYDDHLPKPFTVKQLESIIQVSVDS